MTSEVPEGWKEGDVSVFPIVKGKSSPSYKPGNVPYISPEYLRNGAEPEYVKQFEKAVLIENGETILLWDGSNAGEVFKSKKGILASTMVTFTTSTSQFDKEFFFYSIKFLEEKIRSETRGSGIPHVDKATLKRLPYQYPKDLKEQEKIAKILQTIDKNIDKTKALIEKHKKMKEGLMHDLFNEVIHKCKPEKIKEIAKVKGGKRMPKGSDFTEYPTPFPYIRVIDFKEGSVDTSDLKYVHPKDESKITRYKISSDDVYITIAGTIGLVGNIPDKLDKAQLTENAAKITGFNKKRINKYYLSKFLSYDYVQRQIWKEIGTGGGVPKLALFRIENLEICLPLEPTQEEIVKKIDSSVYVLTSEQTKYDKLLKMKSGLMQDLLTGKVRVAA